VLPFRVATITITIEDTPEGLSVHVTKARVIVIPDRPDLGDAAHVRLAERVRESDAAQALLGGVLRSLLRE
jgi:hypothetical protein